MCGIFGFNLKTKANKDVVAKAMVKAKILGLYNQSRGRDSCGISIDDKLHKGVLAVKHWDDFIETRVLPQPKQDFTVLGHTRMSTKGSHTEANAHPFNVKDRLVGVHNGVIHNIDSLLRKYDLDPKDYAVDSLGLYHLIEQEGFEILNQYVGHAALAFKYLDDPSTLYLYHGASRDYKGSKVWEERPLYYMITKEGLYFSSLEESLNAIKEEEDEKVECLNYNYVFQIKNGDFTKNAFPIDRDDVNIEIKKNTSSGNANQAPTSPSSTGSRIGRSSATPLTDVTGADDISKQQLIMTESLPVRAVQKGSKNIIYFHMGRYWIHPRTLCTGMYRIYKGGHICTEENPVDEVEQYWFYRGILLNDERSYLHLKDLEKLPNSFLFNQSLNFAAHMGKYSMFPVANFVGETTKMGYYHKNAWYQNDKRYNGTFTPKWSGRHYHIKNGFLMEITSTQQGELTRYNTIFAANAELEVFVNGGVLSSERNKDADVGGGTSASTPFPGNPEGDVCGIVPGSSRDLCSTRSKFTGSEDNPNFKQRKTPEEIQEEEGDDNPKWWFEVKFRSIEEAVAELGKPELEALKRYIKVTYEKDFPLELDAKEIDMQSCDIIVTAVTSKCAIIDLCETEEDKHRLKRSYEIVLDEIREANFMETVARIDSGTKEYNVEEYQQELQFVFNHEEEGENECFMDVREILEENIETAEGMLKRAEDLSADVDNDLFQELAASLYKNVSTIQGNLASVAEKYNYKDLAARIKNLNRVKAVG